MNEVLRLQVARPGLEALARIAERFTGERQDLPAIVRRAKSEVLTRLFPGELRAWRGSVAELCGLEHEPAARRAAPARWRAFRSTAPMSPAKAGRRATSACWKRPSTARRAMPTTARARHSRASSAGWPRRTRPRTRLLQALQRLSGPVMAKAVEDTAFYRYHRLLALNEVGGEADSMGAGPEAFHRKAAWRLEH